MRFLSALLALTCALPAWAQDAGLGDPPALPAAAPDAASFISRLDELWKTRDSADAVRVNDEAIAEGLKAYPKDYDLLWRAARVRWWFADGVSDEARKKQIAKDGWAFAKRAVEVKPAGPEGHYYTALAIGAYSQAVGVLAALGEGLEGQFVENLDFSIKNNASFDRYGGHTAKGRYWWELPWPKRNLSKSKEELQRSIDKHPEHLRNYYFLADTLLKDGDAKGAKVQVDKALSGDAAYDPPEARRVKAWAKTLSEKIDAALR